MPTPFDLVRSKLHLARAMPAESAQALVAGLEAALPQGNTEQAKALSRALADNGLAEAAPLDRRGGVPFSGRRARRR